MKKFLKLGLGVTFAFIMMLSLTGCGNNENKPNNDGGNNSSQNSNVEITVDNWSSVIKKQFNLDLKLPNGWTVKEAKAKKSGRVNITFIPSGSVSYSDFGETLFNEIKKNYTKRVGAKLVDQEFSNFDEANIGGNVEIKAIASDETILRLDYKEHTDTIKLTLEKE